MRRRQIALTLGTVAGLALAPVVLMPVPAYGHTHPTRIETDSAGVVFITAKVHVTARLVSSGALFTRTYEPSLGSASGFTVDPRGYIVTDAALIPTDRTPARIFAVNHLFSERYPSTASSLLNDEFTKHQLTAGPINDRLQTCYERNSGNCLVTTSLRVTAYPYLTKQDPNGALPARVLTRDPAIAASSPDVAILKVGTANNMPTVDFAQRAAGAHALSALGFTGVPATGEAPPQTCKPPQARNPDVSRALLPPTLGCVNAHVGADKKADQADDLKKNVLLPALTDGLRGGPVVAEKGQVVGFFTWNVAPPGAPAGFVPDNPTYPRLISAETIRKSLDLVGVRPHPGDTDSAFENALHRFKNSEFAGAIPLLQQTVKLYPDHFIAAADLQIASAKKGTKDDLTGLGSADPPTTAASGGDSKLPLVAGVVVAAALVGVVVLLVLLRRRQSAESRRVPATGTVAPRAPVKAERKTPPHGTSAAAPAQRTPTRPPVDVNTPVPVSGPSGAAQRSPTAAGAASARLSTMPAPQTDRPAAPAPRDDGRAFCTSCGQRVAPNHRFCGWCGHPVS